MPLAARRILDLVLPRACALCGSVLAPCRAYPLCEACDAKLPRISARSERRCERCGKELISERALCLRCRSSGYHFDSAYPLYAYRGIAKELIVGYKLRNRRSLDVFLAEEAAKAAIEYFPGALLVPVPPRPGKLRRKGWDQVEAIARIMERRYGIRVRRILARRGRALEQKNLDFSARAANMRACMRVCGKVEASARYLVLDDVFTTGATLSACALALKTAGAARVDALVLAAD